MSGNGHDLAERGHCGVLKDILLTSRVPHRRAHDIYEGTAREWAGLRDRGEDGIRGSPHTKMLRDLVGDKVYCIDGADFSIGSTLIICEATSSTTCYLRRVEITAQCSGTGVYTPFNLKNIQNVGTIHKDEDLRAVTQCVLAWVFYQAGLKLLSRPTKGGQKNIVIGCMLPDGPFELPGHLCNGANGLDESQGYIVPTSVDLEAVPAVSYVNGASNSVFARLQVTRIGAPFLLSSNRFGFMQFASKTLGSPSVPFSELSSRTSLVKCFVKVDESDGPTVVRLNQTQMRQSSVAKQLENLFRAQYDDQAPVLPYCDHGSTDTPSLLLRCVSEAIVQEVVGMVSDSGRLDGGDLATGRCDFALELLRAVGPDGGSLMMPPPCLLSDAPTLPYSRLAPLGPPSQTRKAAVAEAIEALGGVQFLLAKSTQSSHTFTYSFDTTKEAGLAWMLDSIQGGPGLSTIGFHFKNASGKKRFVRIRSLAGSASHVVDAADLDLKIAIAGAPNRKKYRNNLTTYKRRGPASPTLLPIYRETL